MGTDNKVREMIAAQPKNIIFTGEGDAPEHINSARETIVMPESAAQKKGFYHREAGRIIAMLPHLYKRMKPKGEK